ncbi:MAG: hypothetical protein KAV82_15855, partial [Phycisphaerae bacterium]|nr:hypothetical protein [Phycisphaerae bacterium]
MPEETEKARLVPQANMSTAPQAHNTPNPLPDEPRSPVAVTVSTLEDKQDEVEANLAGEDSFPREDLLAMCGRSSAASGQFDRAAAAYQMFLEEFGTEHAYSARIAMRLADCLAPLDLSHVSIAHEDAGPMFNPQWRMGHKPRREWLEQAVGAYELAAKLAESDGDAGRALLRIGWAHRALDDWGASTAAWERCVAEAAGTRWAAEALWLAAENLSWTGQPAAAAEQLRELTVDYPEDSRSAVAADRAECLEAEARRTPEWLANPVASLEAEIEERAAVRPPHEVYRSVMEWLRREGHVTARIAVGRWACAQGDWPINVRLACHHNLVDALLGEPEAGEIKRLEAADVLEQVMEIAPNDDW